MLQIFNQKPRTEFKCGFMRKLDSETVCCLCDAAHIVGDNKTPYSADDAMAFSKSVSQLGTSGDLSSKELEQMRTWFCHGCLTIINEIVKKENALFKYSLIFDFRDQK